MSDSPSITRERFSGVAEIFVFNRHWYIAGVFGVTAVALLCILVTLPDYVRFAMFGGATLALFWSIASLVVSHWVYDRSALREWKWVVELFETPPDCWCNIHCGLDESSASLRRLFPNARHSILDIFDRTEMTEHSIARARRHRIAATSVNFRQLPLPDWNFDALFLLFAAHELRRSGSRREFFNEVSRILSADGRVVVAEHLRDLPNFIAFGPGAFHFFSRREWLRVFAHAHLQLEREFSITPFVRIFVLRRTE